MIGFIISIDPFNNRYEFQGEKVWIGGEVITKEGIKAKDEIGGEGRLELTPKVGRKNMLEGDSWELVVKTKERGKGIVMVIKLKPPNFCSRHSVIHQPFSLYLIS